jgi:hypothetical protein
MSAQEIRFIIIFNDMRKYRLIAILVFFFGCSNQDAIHKLNKSNNIIDRILIDFIKKEDINNDSDIIYLRVSESFEKQIIVRVAFFDKKGFSFAYETIGEPFGFFNYKGKTVIVYGDKASLLLKRTDDKEYFAYLPMKEVTKNDNSILTHPPINFEPIVYVYELRNNDFIFRNCDRFLINRHIIYQNDTTILITVINCASQFNIID